MLSAQPYDREEPIATFSYMSDYSVMGTYSSGATKKISMRLNGAGYTNESGALIIPTVLLAKKARYCASASSMTFWSIKRLKRVIRARFIGTMMHPYIGIR